jgi:hypothetical protein
MKRDSTPGDIVVPPALQWVMDEARRPRSAQEEDAGRRFILGEISVREYLAALHEARSRH